MKKRSSLGHFALQIRYPPLKKRQSINIIEDEIHLQKFNDVDMDPILHSTNMCSNFMNHVATEIINALVMKVVSAKSNSH